MRRTSRGEHGVVVARGQEPDDSDYRAPASGRRMTTGAASPARQYASASSDFVTTTEDLSASPLWNHDLAPTAIEQRTWSTYNIAALWIGMRKMPESARWHLSHGQLRETVACLKQVRVEGVDEPIVDEVTEMVELNGEGGRLSHRQQWEVVMESRWTRRLLLVGIFLAVVNQTTLGA